MVNITFSKKSENDLDEIYYFIAQDSKVYAKQTIDSILNTINTLKKFSSLSCLYSNSSKILVN
ncbi:MAG: type II toxin-antitoxin system RelE/ParE family toxin [Nanoarchaeota archaeon]|nr:type II toxin-antitoxin system RelE/ParE family toxin [Nanoarchaeota archaeon]